MGENQGVDRSFKGKRRIFKGVQRYPAGVEKVFPLLCPVREAEYLPQWRCKLIYLASGTIEEGGVFETDLVSEGFERDIWVVSSLIPNRSIQFVRVSRKRAMTYNIRVAKMSEPGTVLEWTQVVTGLNPKGNEYVHRLVQSDFTVLLKKMEDLLKAYLNTLEQA